MLLLKLSFVSMWAFVPGVDVSFWSLRMRNEESLDWEWSLWNRDWKFRKPKGACSWLQGSENCFMVLFSDSNKVTIATGMKKLKWGEAGSLLSVMFNLPCQQYVGRFPIIPGWKWKWGTGWPGCQPLTNTRNWNSWECMTGPNSKSKSTARFLGFPFALSLQKAEVMLLSNQGLSHSHLYLRLSFNVHLLKWTW